MKRIFYLLIILALFIAGCVPAPYEQPEPPIEQFPRLAAVPDLYVSPTGSDSGNGLQSNPFKTVQKCANTATAGQVCGVAAGVYNERPTISRSGVSLVAMGTAQTLGFTITGSNNVVSGFYVFNATGQGGIVDRGTGNIIRNNRIEAATLTGISAEGNNYLIEYNVILHTRTRGSGDNDGIRFWKSGVIQFNEIRLSLNPADSSEAPHTDCFQTWKDSSKGIAANVTIHGNLCVNNHHIDDERKGQGVMLDLSDTGAGNITFTNNIFDTFRGMYVLNMTGLILKNNIFVGGLRGGSGIILQNVKRAVILNNIFYNNSSSGIEDCCTFLAPLQAGWNWSYRSDGGTIRGVKYQTDSWGKNPMFVNPSAGDYHLASNSPACTGGESGTYVGAYPCDGSIPPTATITPTITKTPTGSPTPTQTSIPPTRTNTPISTVGNSQTPTRVVPTVTVTPTRTASNTPTVTRTLTPRPPATITPVPTSTPVFDKCDFNKNGSVSRFEKWICSWFD